MDSAAVVAASMVAMMLPTAAPFFVAYARGVRRPASTALAVLTYSAVWTVIGVAAYLVMSRIMLPAGLYVAGAAIAFAGLYSLAPWKWAGQARCHAMCRGPAVDRGLQSALAQGLRYSAGCVACSAGVMVAVILLGMSSVALMAAASAVILLYKIGGDWTRRSDLAVSAIMVVVGVWLMGVM